LSEQLTNSKLEKAAATSVIITETPFDKRCCCWFCGEPSHVDFIFPPQTSYHENKYLVLSCPHPTISVPCCAECQKLASKARADNIWAVNAIVKKQLLKRHAKDLAIGVNWTQAELASSEFEQGNFAGFARSAWFIYEVAKGRVSYLSWPLVVNGIELDDSANDFDQQEVFHFDDVTYPSIGDAIEHYAKIFLIDPQYVSAVLQQLSDGKLDAKHFAQAIRFCRLLVNATSTERKVAFNALVMKKQQES
jgi:hypothetical protein